MVTQSEDDIEQQKYSAFTGDEMTRLCKIEKNHKALLARLNHIFNTLDNSFWGAELNDFKMLYVSPGNEKIYGYSDKEFELKPGLWYHVIIPEDKHIGKYMIAEIGKGLPVTAEYRIRHKSGEIKWIEVRMTPSLNEQGNAISVDGIALDITERKKSINRVSKSEANFKNLVESISGVYWVNNLETYQTLYISPSYETIWGRTCEEVYNNPSAFINSVHPDDRTALFEAHKNITDYNQVSITYRIIRPDGEIRWISAKTNVKVDENGDKIEYGYAEDITASKTIDELQQRSEESLNEAQRLAKIGSWEFNLQDFDLVWSKEQYRIFEMEETPANKLWELCRQKIHPDDIPALDRAINIAINKGESVDYEHRIICKDGSIKYLLGIGDVYYINEGKTKMLRGTVQDITDRKKAEEKLRDSEQRLLEAQNVARIGDFTYNFETGVWKCSATLDEITGLDEKSILIFENWVTLIAPEYREEMIGKIFPLIKEGTFPSGHYLDCKIKRASDGEERWVSIFGELERDAKDRPVKLKGTVQDITERKKAEDEIKNLNESLEQKVEERTAELKQLNRELETFNHTVSHDLQNPIRSLAGFSRLLLNEYSDKLDEDGKEYLTAIEVNAKRMSSLVRDLLSFAKLGKIAIAKVDVDMAKVAQSTIDEIKSGNEDFSTEIILHDLLPAFCDAGLIRQVWDNLIGNAVKYSSKKENPKVEIGMKKMDGENIYYVKDNGAGFDMRDASRLFKVFERLHKSHEFEGTGVGLSTVERIISKQGGKIWAEGKKNRGAAFYFTLPSKANAIGYS